MMANIQHMDGSHADLSLSLRSLETSLQTSIAVAAGATETCAEPSSEPDPAAPEPAQVRGATAAGGLEQLLLGAGSAALMGAFERALESERPVDVPNCPVDAEPPRRARE